MVWLQAFIQALFSTAVFPQRFSFFTVCLVQWFCGVAPQYAPKGKIFKFRSADHCKIYFSWIFLVILEWGVLNKTWLQRCIKFPFMCVCKYLNQRPRRTGEKNGKSFKVFSKTKKKKQHLESLSFITQFKIEFLLTFTGCRKMLGKMPGLTN